MDYAIYGDRTQTALRVTLTMHYAIYEFENGTGS